MRMDDNTGEAVVPMAVALAEVRAEAEQLRRCAGRIARTVADDHVRSQLDAEILRELEQYAVELAGRVSWLDQRVTEAEVSLEHTPQLDAG